jgi:hypothetical protein
MNETSKSLAENWVAGQQAMWKPFFPWTAGQSGEPKPAANANPLEEQFNELRDTWQASVAKWTDFAKEATQGELPSADKLRDMFSPAAWAQASSTQRCSACWKARATLCSGTLTANCSNSRS